MRRILSLFHTMADAQVEADDAVLIAGTNDGKVAIEIILALNNLLRALRDVGGIGYGYVVSKFLLDTDLRPVADGVGFAGKSLRVDLDVAGAEQALQPAADGSVQSLTENECRSLIGEDALAGLFL